MRHTQADEGYAPDDRKDSDCTDATGADNSIGRDSQQTPESRIKEARKQLRIAANRLDTSARVDDTVAAQFCRDAVAETNNALHYVGGADDETAAERDA